MHKTYSLFPLVATLFSSLASASCIHGTSLMRREAPVNGKVKVSNFGYTGLQGPLNWAQLETGNFACATSKVQSPVNIDKTIPLAAEVPVINFPAVQSAEFENLGTTLEVIVNGTTTFAGKDFQLKQFHFHTPSEHRISEEYFPLEMHMVHEAADGAIAVIAVNFELSESGATTELLTQTFRNVREVVTPGTFTETGPLDFEVLKQHIETQGLFQYTGSLTTPPCSEGITFLVSQHPMPINVATFNSVKKVIKFNSRYTQNTLNEQNLIEIASAGFSAASLAAQVPPTTAVGSATAAPTETIVEATSTESTVEVVVTSTTDSATETATETAVSETTTIETAPEATAVSKE